MKIKDDLLSKIYIDISKQVNNIVDQIMILKKSCYPNYELPISYLTIFSQSEKEYKSLIMQLSKLGDEITTNNGFKYDLKIPIKTNNGDITLIRIRQPDIHRRELGCADLLFKESEYATLRKTAIEKDSMLLLGMVTK